LNSRQSDRVGAIAPRDRCVAAAVARFDEAQTAKAIVTRDARFPRVAGTL
jgi:hypothetical protein